MLNAISAVCDAFCASLLAVSKHIRPSSILSRVLFILVNKLCPTEYDAEKLVSTWQERREPLQVNMYKHNSMDIYTVPRFFMQAAYNARMIIQKRQPTRLKENNGFHANRSLMSFVFVGRLNTMLCKSDNAFVSDRQDSATRQNTQTYLLLSRPKAHLGVHFSRPFVFCKPNNSKQKKAPTRPKLWMPCFHKLGNTKLANSLRSGSFVWITKD